MFQHFCTKVSAAVANEGTTEPSAAADAFRGHMHTDAHAMERSSALQLLKGCVDLQRVREISGALSTHAAVAEAANETEDMC